MQLLAGSLLTSKVSCHKIQHHLLLRVSLLESIASSAAPKFLGAVAVCSAFAQGLLVTWQLKPSEDFYLWLLGHLQCTASW